MNKLEDSALTVEMMDKFRKDIEANTYRWDGKMMPVLITSYDADYAKKRGWALPSNFVVCDKIGG